MTEASGVRATIFAKDLPGMAAFYSEVLGMRRERQDENYAMLEQERFQLIVHRIPPQIAAGIEIAEPPVRREGAAVRLDFSVASVARSRLSARRLGGDIDELPPAWAARSAGFYLGFDPEGNVFGISERLVPSS